MKIMQDVYKRQVYYHTNDTRFIAHASTYLKDKAFLNEYMD